MDYKVEKQLYDEIAQVIHSDSSPVGIDAKKTHILIIKMLSDINKRLDGMERELAALREGKQG